MDKTEIQYSRHALFLSECLAWIQKSDVFYSIVGILWGYVWTYLSHLWALYAGNGSVESVFLCVGSGCGWRVSKSKRFREISQEIIHHMRAGDGLRFCFICIHGGIINRQKWEQVSVVWAVAWAPAVFLETFVVQSFSRKTGVQSVLNESGFLLLTAIATNGSDIFFDPVLTRMTCTTRSRNVSNFHTSWHSYCCVCTNEKTHRRVRWIPAPRMFNFTYPLRHSFKSLMLCVGWERRQWTSHFLTVQRWSQSDSRTAPV